MEEMYFSIFFSTLKEAEMVVSFDVLKMPSNISNFLESN